MEIWGEETTGWPQLLWHGRGEGAGVRQELPLSWHSPMSRQKSKMLCCVQHSAAREHCLLCLCFRGSPSYRVTLQGKLLTAAHVWVIRLQNYGCWFKAEPADFHLWVSSKRSWFFLPSQGQTGLKKTKETVYTLKKNSLCEMDLFCYSEWLGWFHGERLHTLHWERFIVKAFITASRYLQKMVVPHIKSHSLSVP